MANTPTSTVGKNNGVIVQNGKLAATGLALLQRALILPALFDKRGEGEFKGAVKDTINIKRPTVLKAKSNKFRSKQAYTFVNQLNEWSIPVTLDDNLYTTVALPDDFATMDLQSKAEQVIAPQIRAIAEAWENYVAAKMKASFTPVGASGVTTITAADDFEAGKGIRNLITRLRKQFNDENVSANGRYLVVGSEVERLLLNDPHLTKMDESGTTTALREAVIGKLYSFTIISSNSVGENDVFAFVSSALQLVSMAPVSPQGASFASSLSANGVSLRYIQDYDIETTTDRSLINTYIGCGEVKDIPVKELDKLFDAAGNSKNGLAAVEDIDPATLAKQIRGLQTSIKVVAPPAK
ncbi:hypothetical protein ACFZCK_14165 [Kitasatospora purpeofusca]|uniref:hypothetical protein n=1 Tax=Kitasatospora purpeofusca TaxID=67352 RepID=UPI0036EA86EF